jgi:hypothetical protein
MQPSDETRKCFIRNGDELLTNVMYDAHLQSERVACRASLTGRQRAGGVWVGVSPSCRKPLTVCDNKYRVAVAGTACSKYYDCEGGGAGSHATIGGDGRTSTHYTVAGPG